MTIGVLAIQGDFAAHIIAIEDIGADTIEVRCAQELDKIDALIIPGGESTTMMKFIDEENLARPITNFASSRAPGLRHVRGSYRARARRV